MHRSSIAGALRRCGLRIADLSRCREGTRGEDGYYGFQNPAGYFQVSSKSVDIPHLGHEIYGFRTESRIGPNATREDCVETAIARAYEYMGTPYDWGWTNAPGVGIDCSGLVIQALYATGMDISPFTPWLHYESTKLRTTDFMRNTAGFKRVSFDERQRGDLVFYEGHVAIYPGDDQIIEATPPSVRVSSVYTRPVIAVRRAFI